MKENGETMKARKINQPIRSAVPSILLTLMVLCSLLVGAKPADAASWPTVSYGASGVDVRSIQRLLTQRGFTATIDGAFGSGTKTAVVNFQRSRGLTADGIVGARTWGALVITVRSGSSGNAVKAVQEQLMANGCGTLSVDGAFGPGTDGAVRRFQSANGLVADGIVGPNTWMHLVYGGRCSTGTTTRWNWSNWTKGSSASGQYWSYGGRSYISGRVCDTAADSRAAGLRIMFGGFTGRTEVVNANTYGTCTYFEFNSGTYRWADILVYTQNSWGRYDEIRKTLYW